MAKSSMAHVEKLKLFLAIAPTTWPNPSERINRHKLPNNETISCVFWNNLFYITGTDIVRCLSYRFEAIGRPVTNMKKFEEGVFSDLRHLKSGQDATLEDPRSDFLEFLFKHNCIRTQKKQKVYFWYSVPHDRLFLDALERDLKRESLGQETATSRIDNLSSARPYFVQSPISQLSQNPKIPQSASDLTVEDIKLGDWLDESMISPTSPVNPHNSKFGHSNNSSLVDLYSPAVNEVSQEFTPVTGSFTPETTPKLATSQSAPSLLLPQSPLHMSQLKTQMPTRQKLPSHHSPISPRNHNEAPVMKQKLIAPIFPAPQMLRYPLIQSVPEAAPNVISSANPVQVPTIVLEGSPNYKKYRRRSATIRPPFPFKSPNISSAKPYSIPNQFQKNHNFQPYFHQRPQRNQSLSELYQHDNRSCVDLSDDWALVPNSADTAEADRLLESMGFDSEAFSLMMDRIASDM